MIDWLKHEWVSLASKYIEDTFVVEEYWVEIQNKYSAKNRFYHNLNHLYNMFLQLKVIKDEIINYDLVRFAIWYHDVIYNSSKSNNEVKSAIFAKKHLKKTNLDEKSIEIIQNLIISTKKHFIILKENRDNAYLLDLDLSILGTNWEPYKEYIENIRLEYKIYPDFLYNSGRKKVLLSFLERESLFLTNSFRNTLESTARTNLRKEIELLN